MPVVGGTNYGKYNTWCSMDPQHQGEHPSAALSAVAVDPDTISGPVHAWTAEMSLPDLITNLTCAAIKQRGGCLVARHLGVCSCSCPRAPGGCKNKQVAGHAWSMPGGDMCADIEQKAWCSLTTPDNVGPGWRSSLPLSTLRDSSGMSAPEACCVCGGGVYPSLGAPSYLA